MESSAGGFARTGCVERIDGDWTEVRLASSHALERARLALSGATPSVGDEVLLVGGEGGDCFVVALLGPSRRRLELVGGARAEVEDDEPEVLRLFSKSGELVLEYDAALGRAKLQAGSGDLEIVAADGNLRLKAANTLQLDAERIVARSRRDIRLDAGDASRRSSLTLSVRGVRLLGPLVETVAQRVEVRAQELRQTVQQLVTHARDVQLVAERVESVAEQVIEKTKQSYRSVEDVAQLCAGRIRILVQDTYHLKARKTLLRSSRDFKVKADQIHLG